MSNLPTSVLSLHNNRGYIFLCVIIIGGNSSSFSVEMLKRWRRSLLLFDILGFFIEQQQLLLSIFGRFLLGKPSFDEPNSSNKWAVLFSKHFSHKRKCVMALMVPSSSFMKKLTQFLLFTLHVCEEKTPGVGGTLLQTNKRPSHQQPRRYNCESGVSLSLLVIFPFYLPLDRNCWLLGVSYALEWFYNKWRVFASCQKKKKMRTSLRRHRRRRRIINYTFMDR